MYIYGIYHNNKSIKTMAIITINAVLFILFTIAYFFVLVAIFLLTTLWDRKMLGMQALSRFWCKMIFVIVPKWRVEISGTENIDPSKSYVVTINHQSMLDIPLLYHIPLSFKWVSKKEVHKIPFFGQVLFMNKDIAIDRKDPNSLSKLLSLGKQNIDNGNSIMIFPEGTRSKSGRIARFKDGAFMLAKRSGAEILPIVTDGTADAFKGGKINPKQLFRIRVLKPIAVSEIEATDHKEMAKRINGIMVEEHKKLRADLYKE